MASKSSLAVDLGRGLKALEAAAEKKVARVVPPEAPFEVQIPSIDEPVEDDRGLSAMPMGMQ